MGKLADIKTKENNANVEDFIKSVKEEQKRNDSFILLDMMKNATKETPKMWGKSLIGFGNLIYKSSKTGREVEWFKIGFSPRKTNLSLHLIHLDKTLLEQLGKHKTGTGCLYINTLADVDLNVLKQLIDAAIGNK